MFEDGTRFSNIAEGKVFFNSTRIDFTLEAAVGKYRFEFGAEEEGAIVKYCVVKGFDAKAVTGEKQGLPVTVPESEGENAAQPSDMTTVWNSRMWASRAVLATPPLVTMPQTMTQSMPACRNTQSSCVLKKAE